MSVVSHQCIDTGSRFGELLWVVYEYTFGNSYIHTIGPKKMASMAEAIAECDSLIAQVEADVTEQSRESSLSRLLIASLVTEDVTPDFPDELPEFDADVSVDTRRRGFHRWLLRWVWPRDMLDVATYFLGIWTWIDTLSAPDARTYLNIDVQTFNSISQRMGNVLTVSGLYDADDPGEIP